VSLLPILLLYAIPNRALATIAACTERVIVVFVASAAVVFARINLPNSFVDWLRGLSTALPFAADDVSYTAGHHFPSPKSDVYGQEYVNVDDK
jgi:hypothetical protein